MARPFAPAPYMDAVKDARNFPQLFAGYLSEWPEVSWDFLQYPWETIEQYGEHLLRVAQAVAAKFPGIDIWDGHRDNNCLLEEVLRSSMRKYAASKGTFARFFERNLRERLRKETARGAQREARRVLQEREAALAGQRRLTQADEVAATCRRWAVRLLDLAAERLDSQTQVYLRMRRNGASTEDIAPALGIPERSVLNRYGGQKLRRRVREQVRKLVLSLPKLHRRLLVRHLLDEVGLSPGVVEELIGIPVVAEDSVPVMEEEALLALLGWSEESAATFRPDGSMSCEPSLRKVGRLPRRTLRASA